MTEKLVQIQGNGDSVRVSGVVRVIGVRVSGVLLYVQGRATTLAHTYKHSFYVKSIPAWNALPADVVGSASHPEFMQRVSTILTL